MTNADILIHIHQELGEQARISLETRMMRNKGVVSADFAHCSHPHSMVVAYDPEKVQGMWLLNIVRTVDPIATRVGF